MHRWEQLSYCHISGIVYVWIGSNSEPEDARVAEEIVQEGILYDKERFSTQVIHHSPSIIIYFSRSIIAAALVITRRTFPSNYFISFIMKS